MTDTKREALRQAWESFKDGLDPLRKVEREAFAKLDACIAALESQPEPVALPPLPQCTYLVDQEAKRHGMHPAYRNLQNVMKYGGESTFEQMFSADQMQDYARAALAAPKEPEPPAEMQQVGRFVVRGGCLVDLDAHIDDERPDGIHALYAVRVAAPKEEPRPLPSERSVEFLNWWHDIGRYSPEGSDLIEIAFEAGRASPIAEPPAR